jgi:hypothetical protein
MPLISQEKEGDRSILCMPSPLIIDNRRDIERQHPSSIGHIPYVYVENDTMMLADT